MTNPIAGGAIHLVNKRKLRGENVTVSGCTDTIVCVGNGRIRFAGFTFTGTPTGYAVVWGKAVQLYDGVISGAVVAVRDDAGPRLKDVVLSGNGTDLVSVRKPRLAASLCETSQDLAATPWGVCAND